MAPKISIIIVNYNGFKVIKKCIDSILNQSYKNYEIIIVDNNSYDSSISLLKEYENKLKIIVLNENKGFAGGNIEGLKYAKGEYIVLLNNDTEVDVNWLKNLIKPMLDDPEIGICASKMIKYGTNCIDSAGDGCTTTGRGFKIGENEEHEKYTKSRYVFGACAGAVAYRKKMLNEIGFFDDDFFLIHEDTDLNFRAQLAGWKCYYVHSAIVYHKVRSTIGVMSDIAVYYSVRNAEYVWLKNVPLILMMKYFHHKIMQEIGSFVYYCIKHGKYRIYYKAKVDFLLNISSLLKKRKVIQKNRKVTIKYLDQIFTSIFSHEIFIKKLIKIFRSSI